MYEYKNWNMQATLVVLWVVPSIMTLFISLIILSLLSSPVFSATAASASLDSTLGQGIKHSHESRVHTHLLPPSGLKHFHKHMHNGRSHIHPYSPEIGFNHTHDKTNKKDNISTNIESNGTEHEHGGRPHRHVLPPSGVNHLHQHRHGNSSHTHPLTETGAIHFHPESEDKLLSKKNSDFDKQITALLKKPVKRVMPQKRKKKSTLKKKRKRVKKTSPKKRSIKQLKSAKQGNEREVELTTEQKSSERDTANVVSANRQYEIGLRYEKGLGIPINLEQAFKWYTRAAIQGDARAQFNLAFLYENGRGVKRSLKQAVKWYRKAAENRCECSSKTK